MLRRYREYICKGMEDCYEEKRNMSIKAKLLGIIIPVMVAIVVVLVLVAYEMSSGIIGNYSENLLESSVDNRQMKLSHGLIKTLQVLSRQRRLLNS